MIDQAELRALVARLEAGESGRAADADIAVAIDGDTFQLARYAHLGWVRRKNGVVEAPHYTTVVDAALMLKPEDANRYGFDAVTTGFDAYWSRNNVSDGHWLVEGRGATPALAFCIARLKRDLERLA